MLPRLLAAFAFFAIFGSSGRNAALPAAGGRRDVRVNDFLSYSPANRSVTLRLLAGYNGVNDTLNFNGGANGSHTIVVPLGWRVDLTFENLADLPHSALVLASTDSIPEVPAAASLPDAYTTDYTDGVMTGQPVHVSFVAAREGAYRLVCGVPNHARHGMWIYFLVRSESSTPAYLRNGHQRAHNSGPSIR